MTSMARNSEITRNATNGTASAGAIVTRFECYESSIACGIVAGNLCRCADYDKILTSVMRAAEITRGA